MSKKHDKTKWSKKEMATYGGIASAVIIGGALATFATYRYRIACPNEYVIRTGLGIKTVSIDKKAFQWPFQTVNYINLKPTNYPINLEAMSYEKMAFVLPGVFTIGPQDDFESLKKYGTLLASEEHDTIDNIVKGVIEGEARVLLATMEIEEIFQQREAFKHKIIGEIQKELDQFGLKIYNANIKELEDVKGSEYFVYKRQQTRSTAENKARCDIAKANYDGDVGVKENERNTRVQTSKFEAEAIQTENEYKTKIAESTADYLIKQAEFERKTKIAEIESQKAACIRETELQREVELRNIKKETEKMRSTIVAKAIADAESKERAADAELYLAQKQAESTLVIKKAQAEGLRYLMETSDPNIVLKYIMLENRVFQDLAAQNAEAVKGMNPKITHWVTSGNSNMNPIADVIKNIPPLFKTIQDQTGLKAPKWLFDQEEKQPSQKD